jgi:HK97 family phage portal protein
MIRVGNPQPIQGGQTLTPVSTSFEPEVLSTAAPAAGFIARARKAFQMMWTGQGGGAWANQSWQSRFGTLFYTLFPNTRIDYEREVGYLDKSSLLMAFVEWFAAGLAEAPVIVEERVPDVDKDGNSDGTFRWQQVEDHPLELLLDRPNQFFSAAILWWHFAFFRITSGNCYWWKGRNHLGEVNALWPVPDWKIQPRWSPSGNSFVDWYDYQLDGNAYAVPLEDIIHFRHGVDPDNDRKGLSPVGSLLREIYVDNEASNVSALLMRNSGFTPVVISPKKGVNTTGVDPVKLKQDYMRQTTGDNRAAPTFQSVGVDVQRLTLNVKEMDLKMLRRFPEERVAAVLRVPAIVVGLGAGMDSSTYNNTEQADRRALRSVLIPLLREIEKELTVHLLPEFDGPAGKGAPRRRVRFDTSQLQALQDDRSTVIKDAVTAFRGRLVKRSTALVWIGEKPARDGSDDVYDTGGPSPLAPQKPDEESDPKKPKPQAGEDVDAENADEQEPKARRRKSRLPAEYKDGHKYSTTHFTLGAETAAKIRELAASIPDGALAEDEREANPHVTVKYGLHVDAADEVIAAVQGVAPFKVRYGKTSIFEADEYDVLKVEVWSSELHDLNYVISDAVDNTDTHDRYMPHATVAYLKKGESSAYVGLGDLEDVEEEFSTLTFSSRDGKETLIPLKG